MVANGKGRGEPKTPEPTKFSSGVKAGQCEWIGEHGLSFWEHNPVLLFVRLFTIY